MRALLLAVLSIVGCASHQPAEPEAIDMVEPEASVVQIPEVNVPDEPEAAETEPAEPAPPLAPGDRRIDAKIVGASPIGCGTCTQQSYEIAPTDGSERFWVHFEQCEGDPPLPPSPTPPDALEMGMRYRLTLRDGGSPNFGAEPRLMAAQSLP